MREAVLRFAVAVVLLGAILLFVDLRKVADAVLSISPLACAVCAATLLLQTSVAAVRWRFVSVANRAPMPLSASVRIFMIGQFFGQFLPSSIGGDAIRMVLVRRFAASVAGAIGLVVSDRLVALVTAVLLITFVSPLTLSVAVPDGQWVARIGALLLLFYAGLGVAVAFGGRVLNLLDRWTRLRPVVAILRDLLALGRHRLAPLIFGLSLVVHALMVGAIGVAAWGLAIPITWLQLAAVGPWIVLCAMLPISFGSWGVREASMIIGLGLVGVGVEQALAASLTVAAGQVAVALIGMVLWLAMGAPKASAAAEPAAHQS
ncbi:MAG: flippase-like domain-containing protein [Rhodospirillales bacterium]|nr:flippase-like domain-containing protein [Rhodospirillales bacterium]